MLTYLTPKTNPFTAVFKTKAHIFLRVRSHFVALSILLQEGSYFQYFPITKAVLLGERKVLTDAHPVVDNPLKPLNENFQIKEGGEEGEV